MVSHVMAGIVVSLVLLVYVSRLSVVMGLDYSYAEGTPGTNARIVNGGVIGGVDRAAAGLVPRTGGGTPPIPPERIIHDVGQTIAGYTADPGGVTGQIDCGAVITQLSRMYRGIPNPPPPKKMTPEERKKFNEDKKGPKREPELTPEQMAARGRNIMNRAVIGVAVVDYGAAGLHAYLSRSGLGLTASAGDADAIRLAAAESARVGWAFNNPAQWTLFSSVVASHNNIRTHQDAHMVPLPQGGVSEAADIIAWGQAPAAGQPEGIYFAVGPQQVVKKWPNGGGWHTETSGTANRNGACALQKLMGNLYGYNGPLPDFPNGGGPRPYLSPNAQTAINAPRLVCAAESAHNSAVPVMPWAGPDHLGHGVLYQPGQEVPSCAACQAYVPVVITQAAGSCAIPAPLPLGFAQGNCPLAPARLHHLGRCVLDCALGFEPDPNGGASTRCELGALLLPAQLCRPRSCRIVVPPGANWNLGTGESRCPTELASGAPGCQLGCNPGFRLVTSPPGPAATTCHQGLLTSQTCVADEPPPPPPPPSAKRSARSGCGFFDCLSRARFVQRRSGGATIVARRQEPRQTATVAGALEPAAFLASSSRVNQVAAPTRARRLVPARIATIQQLAAENVDAESEGDSAIDSIEFLESENSEGPNRPSPPSPSIPSIPSSTPIPSPPTPPPIVSPPTNVRNSFSSTPFVPPPSSPTPVPSPSTILLPTPTPTPSSPPSSPSLRPIIRLGGPSSGPDFFGESRRLGYEEYQRTGKVLGYDINAMVKAWKPPPPTPIPIPPSGSISSSSSSSISVGPSSPLSTPSPSPPAP